MRPATRAAAVLSVAVAMLATGPASAAVADYELVDTDSIGFRSADGVARAYGSVRWYKDGNLIRDIRRGDYSSRAKVRALKPVGCIWAKVHYTHVTGSFDVSPGGPGGSFGAGNYSRDGYWYNCRAAGKKRPKALSLYGVGYAKFALLSTTLEICTSKVKRDGPRFCANKKVWYPVGADG